MHRRLGSATLSQLAFPRKGNPNFPWEKSFWDNTVVISKKSKSNWSLHCQWHIGARPFYLALPLRSFDVGRVGRERQINRYAINLSACGRYTTDCGIPSIQNAQINRTEVARCTLSVSCSTDLDYCAVFVDRVGVFLEHMHRTLRASERFTPNFPVVSVLFACLVALVAITTTAATFT